MMHHFFFWLCTLCLFACPIASVDAAETRIVKSSNVEIPEILNQYRLPEEISFDAMTSDEVKEIQIQTKKVDCLAWAFLINQGGRLPVMATFANGNGSKHFIGAQIGVAKINNVFRRFEGRGSSYEYFNTKIKEKHAAKFQFSDFRPRTFADATKFLSASMYNTVPLNLISEDVQIRNRSTSCTFADRKCRVYVGEFKASWLLDNLREQTIEHPAIKLEFEDSCPATSAGMFENFNSKLSPLHEKLFRIRHGL